MEYRPLNSDRNEIRLLEVLYNEESKDIHCSFYYVFLEDAPPFIALSYFWGDPIITRAIYVDGRNMPVTINLEAALQQLRSNGHTRLWADAVCINQGDINERSRQILKMADIYKRAEMVIAWLGVSADGSDLVFDWMNSISAEPDFEPEKVDIEEAFGIDKSVIYYERTSPMIRALNKFVQRPYWSRTWVVQEIVSARNIRIHCGPCYTSWEQLSNAVAVFYQPLPFVIVGVSNVFALIALREKQQKARSPGLELFDCIKWTEEFEATDPRDKIYGLLAMAMDSQTLIPSPNYQLSLEDIEVRLTRAFLTTKKNLDLICLRSATRADSVRLPSWVPGWFDLNESIYSSITRTTTSDKRVYAATGDSHARIKDLQGNLHVLSVEGFEIDTIDGLGFDLQYFPYNEQLKTGHKVDPSPNFSIVQPNNSCTAYGSDAMTYEAIWRTFVLNFERWDIKMKVASEAYGRCFSSLYSPTSQNLVQDEGVSKGVFAAWVAKNGQLHFNGRTLKEWANGYRWSDIVPLGQRGLDPGLSIMKNFFNAIQKAYGVSYGIGSLNRKRIVISEQGYIGMTHRQARKGDKICLLLGCSTPVVLRARHEGGYQVVGDTYIHGIMNGEALSSKTLRDFHLY